MKEYIVKLELIITSKDEDEAIRNFRGKVKNVEASVFEVEEVKG